MALPEALCDRCLGRRLAGAAGLDAQRAAASAWRAGRGAAEVAEAECPVCEGAFADAPRWLAASLEALRPYAFRTFQLGTVFPGPCEQAEREASRALGQEKVGETVRTEANRLLAPQVAAATGASSVPEGRPDVVVQVDTRFWHAEVEPSSVFVRGRYNKLRRDIPQTHWPCRRCEGRGCWECGDTGVTYAESVEDAIGAPALPLFGAASYSFHGAGREDIDALMLGTGRPFVLELAAPLRREAPLEALQASINAATATSGVAVRELRMAAKDEVPAIKEGEYDKEYLAHCVAAGPLTREAVQAACAAISGVTLEQRTPERVAHRRADLVRRRRVHRLVLEAFGAEAVAPAGMAAIGEASGPRFSVRVLAESGTYIKEMVSGDEGRTTPSLSALCGVPVRVEALDVVAILDAPEAPHDAAPPAAPA